MTKYFDSRKQGFFFPGSNYLAQFSQVIYTVSLLYSLPASSSSCPTTFYWCITIIIIIIFRIHATYFLLFFLPFFFSLLFYCGVFLLLCDFAQPTFCFCVKLLPQRAHHRLINASSHQHKRSQLPHSSHALPHCSLPFFFSILFSWCPRAASPSASTRISYKQQ